MEIKQSKRGGKRQGSGRKKGGRDAATGEQRATIHELARGLTDTALSTLERVAKSSSSDAAAVSAATAILDRGYGRPQQSVAHSGTLGTFDLTKLSDEDLARLQAILGPIADNDRSAPGGDIAPEFVPSDKSD